MKKLTFAFVSLVVMGLSFTSLVQAGPDDDLSRGITELQTEWARIKYQEANQARQIEAIHVLEEKASQLAKQFPKRAEPLIWEGIILATDAGIDQGFSALGKLKDARNLFETALEIDGAALEGSAYTSLGSLYYQVPGWPISFRDDGVAEKMLKKAVEINPDGIDPNFFYGDFLSKKNRAEEAKVYLTKALEAPSRPNRPLADAGRRQEIRAVLAELNQK
ncbi:hypothetical protein [Sneathiella limimaris]|uniref:hypothetical protein n=1 Tax=Sneathiella limimaris TaxID=1964213 RepID=UPI00146BEC6A|nr:hypothetical protein [Sneathiella limimaris]